MEAVADGIVWIESEDKLHEDWSSSLAAQTWQRNFLCQCDSAGKPLKKSDNRLKMQYNNSFKYSVIKIYKSPESSRQRKDSYMRN